MDMTRVIAEELSATEYTILKLEEAFNGLESVLTGLALLAKNGSKMFNSYSIEENAVTYGHTHLGPQQVWYGHKYRKYHITTNGPVTVPSGAYMDFPYVWKPGYLLDRHHKNIFVITQGHSDKSIFSQRVNMFIEPVTLHIDMSFIVVNPEKAKRFPPFDSLYFLSDDPESSFEVDDEKVSDIADKIRQGYGMWVAHPTIKLFADLYELKRWLTIAVQYPDMFSLDFGVKPGDIID